MTAATTPATERKIATDKQIEIAELTARPDGGKNQFADGFVLALIARIHQEREKAGAWNDDMELAPMDIVLLLAWWDHHGKCWEYEAGLASSTRGGWFHGRATHWQPLPTPPALSQEERT